MRVFEAALAASAAGEPAALCTVIAVNGSAPRSASARMLVYGDGRIVGTIGGGQWEKVVIDAALVCIREGTARRVAAHLTRDLGMCCGGAMEAFVEPITPVERVHLFGAGHVGGALAPLLLSLGFDLKVYDEREEWLNAERFPGCERVLLDPRRALPAELGPRDYVVLVTHSHPLDQDLLEALIAKDYAYLGLIGSKAKITRFFIRLRAAGVDEALLRRVSAPIGLDLGAETPEEIAVAIAAEIIRVRRRHKGPTTAMSERPLPARGGDGVARPPALLDD